MRKLVAARNMRGRPVSERFAMDKKKLVAGDRVQLSALGRERCPRVRWQAGTVLRVLAYQCDVLFDSQQDVHDRARDLFGTADGKRRARSIGVRTLGQYAFAIVAIATRPSP